MSLAPPEVVREGRGLHTGRPSRVILRRTARPVSFRIDARESPLALARVVGTERATAVEVDGRRISTVEHLFAALGGLGIYGGVSIEVRGPELPLLDGAARVYAEALCELGLLGGDAPELEVVRDDDVRVGDSIYSFQRADRARVHVEVTVDLPVPGLAGVASWAGDPRDFLLRVAPARTFAFAAEIATLAEQGGVAHVDPSSVVILSSEEILFAGPPFVPDEPARHKLLDLMGDLFLYGGPPRGRVRAHRPGHRATHEAMREAFERKIVRRTRVVWSPPDAPTGR